MQDGMRTARRVGNRIDWLLGLSRPAKQAILVASDVAGLPLCLAIAFILKSDSLTAPWHHTPLVYAAVVVASIPVFAMLGLYRAVLRYIGPRSLLPMLLGVGLSVLLLEFMAQVVVQRTFPFSLDVIYGVLALGWVAGTRLVAQWILLQWREVSRPVLIYGAGDAGAQLAAALRTNGCLRPVAYVDEYERLQGTVVLGIPVIGPAKLEAAVARFKVERVLLAVPSASRRRRKEILERLGALGLHVQTVPNLDDIVAGRAEISELQEVDVADLLGRDPVQPDEALLGACIRGKSVMVTGAGGSIGSELCRQVLRQQPKRLVLLEMSEVALYTIEQELSEELSATGQSTELHALLGDAYQRDAVLDVLRSFGVQTIYHAAAYKHVPIVERNVVKSVYNNVYSAWHTAEAAREAGVETFVLISTDKAVNPTNVMGATKRFAEIILQSLQTRSIKTRFCMVRFGNVLGSSGSVVPLFRKQIVAGGPVTVTHPEILRYFMTIPEAVALVLQAGSMGSGGDVFVLDMGEAVKIDSLARRMIGLMGQTVRDDDNPDGDIEIRYTGLRPGEKLYEELLIGNNVSGTGHPMIMRAVEDNLPWHEVEQILKEMTVALQLRDCDAVIALLERAVQEYRRADKPHDIVWRRKLAARADGRKVIALEGHRVPSEAARLSEEARPTGRTV